MKNINFVVEKMRSLVSLGADVSNVQFYIHPLSENVKTGEINDYSLVRNSKSDLDIPVFSIDDFDYILPMDNMEWETYEHDGKWFYELHYYKDDMYETQMTWGKSRLECLLVMYEDLIKNNFYKD